MTNRLTVHHLVSLAGLAFFCALAAGSVDSGSSSGASRPRAERKNRESKNPAKAQVQKGGGQQLSEEQLVAQKIQESERRDRSSRRAAEPTSIPLSGITWSEIHQAYGAQSDMTELQKKELWKRYKGKRVKWSGEVTHVGETWGTISVQLKMEQTTLTSDVIVSLRDDQRQRALELREGDYVTVTGTLSDWGTLMYTASLNDGVID